MDGGGYNIKRGTRKINIIHNEKNRSEKRMIELKNVSKAYDNKKIIDSLSCSFEYGKTYVLTGKSGIGKTTLLRVMSGLEKYSGSITGLKNMRKTFLFPEDRLLENLTASENIRFVYPEFSNEKEWFSRFLLDGCEKMKIGEMSTGMKRRLSLMRAFAYSGDVFFLDEPTNGLDPKTAQTILKTMRELLKGKTAFIISHSERDVTNLADCEIVLNSQPVSELIFR